MNTVFQLKDAIIRIEPPRIRHVLLERKPTRLAFPSILFVEGTSGLRQAVYIIKEENKDVFEKYLEHKFDVQFSRTTHADRPWEFPLTTHDGYSLLSQVPRLGNVLGVSHIDAWGVVCYSGDVRTLLVEKALDYGAAFWNSQYNFWDTDFVAAWEKATAAEGQKAAAMTFRRRAGVDLCIKRQYELDF